MKKISELMKQMTAAEGIPSAIIGVRRGKTLEILQTGFADTDKKLVPDEHTIYPIGSCSKAFIAAAVCILCDDGALELDAPVKRYLPEFELYTRELTDQLTLRDMLCHNAGLSTHDLLYECAQIDMRELVRRMRYMPPRSPFRYTMHYQNHMFALASLLVERVSQMPWDMFLQKRIFDPLGMTRTFCRLEGFSGDPNRAKPYARKDGQVVETQFQDVYRDAAAAGCISSTIHDMDIWLRTQLGGGQLDGVRIFSAESARRMHSMQNIVRPYEFYPFELDEIEAKSYGLGWCIQYLHGRKLVAHGGSIRGFRVLAAFLPGEDVCFTVLCNLDGTSFQDLIAYQITAEVLGQQTNWIEKVSAEMMPMMGKAAKAEQDFWASIDQNAAPALPSGAYTGRYFSDIYGELAVCEEENALCARLGSLVFALTAVGGNDFAAVYRATGRRFAAKFSVCEGRVASLTIGLDGDVLFRAV